MTVNPGHFNRWLAAMTISWGVLAFVSPVTSQQSDVASAPAAVAEVVAEELPQAVLDPAVVRWLEMIDAADAGLRERWEAPAEPDADADSWQTISLPSLIEDAGRTELESLDGAVWFRREVEVPDDFSGEDLLLSLGAIDDMDEAFVNGVKVGAVRALNLWNLRREYPVPAKLIRPGANVITVRVLDYGWAGGFHGPAASMKLSVKSDPARSIPLAGEWRFRIGVALEDLLGSAEWQRFPETENAIPSASRAPFGEDDFAIGPGETVAFLGQENFVRAAKDGQLESMMAAAFAASRPGFRWLAWHGDKVTGARSAPTLGTWAQQIKTVGADVVVLQFGNVEIVESGGEGLESFIAGYGAALDAVALTTPRMVLVSPALFEPPPSAGMPDLTRLNLAVRRYGEAIAELAAERGALFVDLTRLPASEERLTDDGFHLNAAGLAATTRFIIGALTGEAAPVRDDLVRAVRDKNRLWFEFWRPGNIAFLHGRWAQVPFGDADGAAPSLLDELNGSLALVEAGDELVQAIALDEAVPEDRLPTVDPPAAPGLTPGKSLARLQPRAGWRVSLAASEREDLVNPVRMAWDEAGRLYVVCSPTYPHLYPGRPPGDYVLLLEDRDGDGGFEEHHRFAEGFAMVQGILPVRDGLLICAFDELLFLPDRDGDGREDVIDGEPGRHTVFAGFGTGDTHQLINSLTHGDDGMIWFCQGLDSFSRVETPWGLREQPGAGLWRLHPETRRLDSFFGESRAGINHWGVAFDDWGQLFQKCAASTQAFYSVPGLTRSREWLYGMPDVWGGTKSMSLQFVGTGVLPDLDGRVLSAGFLAGNVEVRRLADKGAGFIAEREADLLTSDDDGFRPVDVSVGPDGAVYVLDFCNRIIGHYAHSYRDPQRDRTRGRLWRLTPDDFLPVTAPELDSQSAPELVKRLGAASRWTRSQARRLLCQREGEDVVGAVDAWVRGLAEGVEGDRLGWRALGVYHAHQAVRPALLERLLVSDDFRVRAFATRFAGHWADDLADAGELLAMRSADPHPRVRLEAVVAATWLDNPEAAVRVATEAADREIDAPLRYAIKQSMASVTERSGLDTTAIAASAGRAGAVSAGRDYYERQCVACHLPDGNGIPGLYPPLAGSAWVAGDSERLIRILLHGLEGTIEREGVTYGIAAGVTVMPASAMSDGQMASVLTFIRSEFGNGAAAVTREEVARVRAADAGRDRPWRAAELEGSAP